MTIEPADAADSISGDAWVETASGAKYWGRFGAAGLFAIDPDRGVLLQHRVGWSHFGGTWGLPGGALQRAEDPVIGALREAAEEAAVAAACVRPRFTNVFDASGWTYTTVVADVVQPFEPVISDPESVELRWVPLGDARDLPLHPGLASAWGSLTEASAQRPVLLIDAANVVGSVPDGWWRDRAGAAERLRDRLATLAEVGIPAGELGMTQDRWFAPVEMVVEGKAADVSSVFGVDVIRADGSGDDTLAARAEALAADGCVVTAVTSDRALRARLESVGASVRGAGWLLSLLGRCESERPGRPLL